jgi:hypothetical protein
LATTARKNSGTYELYGGKTKRQHLMALHGALQLDRSTFDGHWREIADFLMPRRARFVVTDKNRGDRRNQNIIDSTGRFAMRTLESGLHAGMTSPQVPWFNLGLADQDLMKFGPVKEWLHDVRNRMATVFIGSNLYNSLPTLYGDMGLFGTGAVAILPDTQDLIRSYVYPIGSYNLGMDNRGLVSTFTTEYQRTVEQVVAEFGGEDGQPCKPGQAINWTNISNVVKDHWEKGNYNVPVMIVWVITKNYEHRPNGLHAKFYPFSSCHLEVGSEPHKILRESGFKYFPILAPRWHVTDTTDSFGNDCPGMTALGDVKGLQIMQKEMAKAIRKQISPPMQAPAALLNSPIAVQPDGVTHVDVREGMQGVRSLYDVNINLSDFTNSLSQVQFRIERAFYADLFLMLAQSDQTVGGRQKTAREIEERHDEKFVALGPLVERTGTELLTPLIDVTFNRMADAGLIPDAPEELEGLAITPEYISTMAQAQKLINVGRQDRFLQAALSMIEVDPSIIHKLDTYQIIDAYADMYGVDPRLVVATDVARERANAAQQAQQAAMQAQTAKDAAQAGKLASETNVEQPSALTRLIEQGVV